jgi:hypothetical protein
MSSKPDGAGCGAKPSIEDKALLGAGFGVSRATAYRYLAEGIKVLAAQAPDLHTALQRVADEGWSHVILDGKLFHADRLAETTTSFKGETIDAWYSGKHRDFAALLPPQRGNASQPRSNNAPLHFQLRYGHKPPFTPEAASQVSLQVPFPTRVNKRVSRSVHGLRAGGPDRRPPRMALRR